MTSQEKWKSKHRNDVPSPTKRSSPNKSDGRYSGEGIGTTDKMHPPQIAIFCAWRDILFENVKIFHYSNSRFYI